jgi:hypothetical protein
MVVMVVNVMVAMNAMSSAFMINMDAMCDMHNMLILVWTGFFTIFPRDKNLLFFRAGLLKDAPKTTDVIIFVSRSGGRRRSGDERRRRSRSGGDRRYRSRDGGRDRREGSRDGGRDRRSRSRDGGRDRKREDRRRSRSR